MKVFVVILGIALCISSCSKNNTDPETEKSPDGNLLQEWTLTKMTGMVADSERTGNDMEWQETITLGSDGTFIKTRVAQNKTVSVSGIYKRYSYENEKGFILTHEKESTLINNCSSSLEESLYFDPTGTTLLSAGWACDQPGLFYRKK